jgi:hypothetical protein
LRLQFSKECKQLLLKIAVLLLDDAGNLIQLVLSNRTVKERNE